MNNCKIKSKNVSNNSSSAVAELMVDVYLVELSERFSVISVVPGSRRLLMGSDISEILSFNVSHELRKYLLSYGQSPIVIPTFVGDALILPQLFPSSRLFAMVFFKHSRPDSILRIASSERFEGRVASLREGERARIRKWDEPFAERLDSVLNIADNILNKSLISIVDDPQSFIEKCNALFDNISALTGVDVNLSIDEDIEPNECFDAGLFNSFCVSMIMLCQRYARSDTADVRIFKRALGLSVYISFASAKKISRVLNPDVAHFNAISEANNMILESSFAGGRFEVIFTPARKDWSFLELKLPNDFII